MLNNLLLSFFSILISFFSSSRSNITPINIQHLIEGKAQGTTYLIKYINKDSIVSKSEIDLIFASIDSSLSLYKNYSTISLFNSSTRGIKTTTHFYNVVHQSIQFYNSTSGTFDITCKPLSSLWGFGNISFKTPTPSDIRQALKYVGSNKIYFYRDSLIKKYPEVQIDCDGIAQGYTVDVIYTYLLNKGISNFIVEIGGEVRSLGKNQKDEPWSIGIEIPNNLLNTDYFVDKIVLISNKAITTSGNYRKFKKLGNKYFSHIIDPIIGKPVNNGIIAVSVIADDALTADALDNALMVMGIERAFNYLEHDKNIGFYITYLDKNGNITDTSNLRFKNYLK